MKPEYLKYIFISWAPHCSRSDNIAREFDGKSYLVYYEFFGSNYITVVFKYLFQSIKSFKIILKEKPDIIFIMSPPIFAFFPPWLYCKIFRKKGYISDSHSATFRQKKWKVLSPLQKFFFKDAISNIVTNSEHANIVRAWGADYTVIGDIPIRYVNMKIYEKMRSGFNITLVNSFSDREPVEKIIKTAKKINNISIYITGKLKYANKALLLNTPNNIIFTDFLPNEQYAWLLKNSNAVMTQTTSDNTMQRGAYEAMALETPIITSDWGILRETFYKGTIFVKNDVDSIIQGILEMKKDYKKYKKEIKELKKERLAIWNRKKELLLDKIMKYSI